MSREKFKNGRPLINDRPVRIIETGEVFKNYIEAAKAIDGSRSCVYLCLTGNRASHKGYSFEYAESGQNGPKT